MQEFRSQRASETKTDTKQLGPARLKKKFNLAKVAAVFCWLPF